MLAPVTARSAEDPDDAWCVAGRGTELVAGPERALGRRADLRARVAIGAVEPADALGPAAEEIHVAESGVRSFTVAWHDLGHGRVVAVNPAGGNQVSWSEPDRARFSFTPGPDPLVTSVYQRFLVRHLTTNLLERDLGGRSIHAVSAELDTGVLAVAGPTCSGKTRLVNRLAGDGLVGRVVDDDCPVLLPGGATATLVPRRYEVERATRHELSVLVVLSHDTTSVRRIEAARAHELLTAIPVPWPASWLPADERPDLPELPPGLPVFEVPAQDEAAHDTVVDTVRGVLSETR